MEKKTHATRYCIAIASADNVWKIIGNSHSEEPSWSCTVPPMSKALVHDAARGQKRGTPKMLSASALQGGMAWVLWGCQDREGKLRPAPEAENFRPSLPRDVRRHRVVVEVRLDDKINFELNVKLRHQCVVAVQPQMVW
jgi:hypothetical protein